MSGDRIEVVGRGTAEVRPDLFVAQLAAEATGPDVATALEAAELASQAMVETARTRGGAGDADLRTAEMSVTTNHDHHGQPDGYRAWLALTVTLRDLAAAGQVLAEVLAAGGDATRLTGVTLLTSDPGAALDLARAGAMADARHQAEQLAALAGRSLGGVRRVSAVPSYGGWPRPAGFQEQSGRAMSLSVEGGTSTVAVSVEVRFDLV
jgi:uncharacterized protein YggE